MKIDLFYGLDPSFGPNDHEELGIGGTENFITYSAEYLALAGHDVRVYNKTREFTESWRPLASFVPGEERDVLLVFRAFDVIPEGLDNTGLTALALADTESHGLGDAIRSGLVDLAMFVGHWQAMKIIAEEHLLPKQWMITSNGVSMRRFDEMRGASFGRISGKCIHTSTPERGLDALLDIWPRIQKQVPHASLHLFSSFKGWKMPEADSDSMCESVYERIVEARASGQNIINHKHVNAYQMRQHMLEAELFLYPTRYFNETCCISALEAAAAGVPIVATDRAALKERVDHKVTGYLIAERADHDIGFAVSAELLLCVREKWGRMSEASVEMARNYDYKVLVEHWVERWQSAIAARR